MTGYEEALLAELEGYERTGRKDRAAQVKAELDRLARPPAPPEPVSVTDDQASAADDPESAPPPKAPPPKAKRARRS